MVSIGLNYKRICRHFGSMEYLISGLASFLEHQVHRSNKIIMFFGQPAPQFSEATVVDAYTSKHLLSSETSNYALEQALSNSAKNGLPPISVSPSQGKFLKIQCQLQGAKNILEIGTLGGYSTIWFAASGKDVHVTSIEINPKHRDVAIENIVYAGLGHRIDVMLGAALDVLPKLAREIDEGLRQKFDFVFIDADWNEQWDYFDWAAKMMEKGSCIYVDNVVRQLLESGVPDAEADSESRPVRGMKELVERVGKDMRVDAVVMQTVGAKSHDGFLMAVVK
jgi:predicted O-methyltransferase YrrM